MMAALQVEDLVSEILTNREHMVQVYMDKTSSSTLSQLLLKELDFETLLAGELKQCPTSPFLVEFGVHSISSFHLAAMLGRDQILNLFLLPKIISVDSALQPGVTALHLASFMGHVTTCRLLLEVHGAEVNRKDRCNWTALHFACTGGHFAVVRTLIEHGVDIGAQDKEKMRALHLAEIYGYTDIVKLLQFYEGGSVAQYINGDERNANTHPGRNKRKPEVKPRPVFIPNINMNHTQDSVQATSNNVTSSLFGPRVGRNNRNHALAVQNNGIGEGATSSNGNQTGEGGINKNQTPSGQSAGSVLDHHGCASVAATLEGIFSGARNTQPNQSRQPPKTPPKPKGPHAQRIERSKTQVELRPNANLADEHPSGSRTLPGNSRAARLSTIKHAIKTTLHDAMGEYVEPRDGGHRGNNVDQDDNLIEGIGIGTLRELLSEELKRYTLAERSPDCRNSFGDSEILYETIDDFYFGLPAGGSIPSQPPPPPPVPPSARTNPNRV